MKKTRNCRQRKSGNGYTVTVTVWAGLNPGSSSWTSQAAEPSGLNAEKPFFLIKLFFAILYKESISNDFQGLWCLDEVFSAKLCWFQNLFVFLQQVSPKCR